MAHSSTARFPNELLVLISSHFCLHCQDAYNESWDERPLQPILSQSNKQQAEVKPWYSIDRQTLCSLSLACRQFRDVAQSVLYHEFVLGYGDSWISEVYHWEDCLAPFIRTIARRPDLARLVKVVYISHRIFDTSEDKEESRRSILLEAANALGVDLLAAWKKRADDVHSMCPAERPDWPDFYPVFIESHLDDNRRLTEKQERQLRRAMTEKSMPSRRWMNAELISMLLAHTPNIDIVSIQSSRGWPSCGITGSSMPALGLTHLPVKRLDLGMSGNLGCVEMEMPCLKNLRITKGFLSAARLSKVLRGCTGGLVAFEYEAAQGWYQDNDTPAVNFQLSDAIELLRLHKSSLQILHLDLTARRGDIRRIEPRMNMKDFTSLQHLWVNTLLLFPIVLPPILGTPTDAEILVQFLPRSIVSLEIYRDGRCFASNALHGLVAVKSEKFPFLRSVVLGPRGGGDLGRVSKAAGISFSNKGQAQIVALSFRAETVKTGSGMAKNKGTGTGFKRCYVHFEHITPLENGLE
ncbi:hypothetical protein FGADI_6087 [Fusarium gaditjirri]|uniref:F-box domain-containing protein n=1 Tax=Fusarium gaditjirri TaxID=282569 RepID=A0A8H4T8Q4_9HYPO|nr:hypothetical protein FGADI_6087 [Fusarium gaditjirri]